MSHLPRTFGELVKRDRCAMTATEAAATAKVTKSFWSDVEHGRRLPSRTVAARMCGAVVGNWNEWIVSWAREKLGDAWDNFEFAYAAALPSGEAE